MTSYYHNILDLNNLSSPRRPFAVSNDGRVVWATVLFLSESCIGQSCMSIFFFFLPYLQDHDLLRSKDFDIMATQRNDFSSLLEYLFFDYILILLQAASLGRKKYKNWRSAQRAIYILT